MELQKRTLLSLQWNELLNSLAERTRSPLGRELCVNHKPLSHAERKDFRNKTKETIDITAEAPHFHGLLSEAADPSTYFELALKNGVLLAQEVYFCGHFMGTCGLLHTEIKNHKTLAPLIYQDYETLPKRPALCDTIAKSVTSLGEILDTASPELAKLRGERTVRRQGFEKYLETKVTEWHGNGLLQDNFYDVLDGRFVVPVKAERQSALPGNLHSHSQTRQSVFMEPVEFMQANNELQELELKIRAEEWRILKQISGLIATAAPLYLPWIAPLAKLDFYFASATLSHDWNLTYPQSGNKLYLKNLFHPLLPLHGKTPVKNSITLSAPNSGGKTTFIISGPNTGGKTVFIKAVALSVLMSQSGLFIPTDEGSVIPDYESVLALIGDDQDIAGGLSSFSAHIKDLKEITSPSLKNSLIVIDEILSSTDPEEASALSQAILEELSRHGHHSLVTTHFSSLSSQCRSEPTMAVAAMEFHNGRPTYHLRIDELGASHAIEIAAGLDFPAHILRKAKTFISSERTDYEAAKKALHQKEIALKDEFDEKMQTIEREMQEERITLKEEKNRLLEAYENFSKETKTLIYDTIEKLSSRMKTYERQGVLSKDKAKDRATEFVQSTLQGIEGTIKEKKIKLGVEKASEKSDSAAIKAGSNVRVLSLNSNKGKVLKIENNMATVQVGILKVQKPLDDLQLISEEKSQSLRKTFYVPTEDLTAPGTTLDLRGKRVDEALSLAQSTFDRAFRSGLPLMKVVTGHGTGAVKTAIKDLLNQLPYVKEYRPERTNDDGAFLVEFEH